MTFLPKRFFATLAVSGLLAVGSASQAAVVTWAFTDANTTLGAVSGSFNYDADTGIFSGISITSTLLTYSTSLGDPFGFGMVFGTADPGRAALTLDGIPLSALTNAGGSLSMGNGGFADIICGVGGCGDSQSAVSNWVAGSRIVGTPTAVPEPASYALVLSSLALLGFSQRRRAR